MNKQTTSVDPNLITLFLCGDVMTGRGIDQILPHPSNPRIFEPAAHSALAYVELAEEVSGPITRPVDFAYIWGDALAEFARITPDARIINLETAVTTSDDVWPKGINYRMHPKNIPCLSAAHIDCCVLANNHVLDWGYSGLAETLSSLAAAGIRTAGAGHDINQAQAPTIIDVRTKAASSSWLTAAKPAALAGTGVPAARAPASISCRIFHLTRSRRSRRMCSR